jgi:hypothetical protein
VVRLRVLSWNRCPGNCPPLVLVVVVLREEEGVEEQRRRGRRSNDEAVAVITLTVFPYNNGNACDISINALVCVLDGAVFCARCNGLWDPGAVNALHLHHVPHSTLDLLHSPCPVPCLFAISRGFG